MHAITIDYRCCKKSGVLCVAPHACLFFMGCCTFSPKLLEGKSRFHKRNRDFAQLTYGNLEDKYRSSATQIGRI